MDEKVPLVSCIMPTYNRPEFITNAIKQFLHQDYPNKELIIIDDGQNPIAHLVPDSVLIRYLRLDKKHDLGTKRNLACERANGKIIVHMDDDDYYAPDWLQKQTSFLTENKLDITGLSVFYFYDKGKDTFFQYTYSGRTPWVYGATLCYTRIFWQSSPFPAVNVGEDNAFVWSPQVKKILPNNTITSYLGLIHTRNTSPKDIMNSRWKKIGDKELVRSILKSHQIL